MTGNLLNVDLHLPLGTILQNKAFWVEWLAHFHLSRGESQFVPFAEGGSWGLTR